MSRSSLRNFIRVSSCLDWRHDLKVSRFLSSTFPPLQLKDTYSISTSLLILIHTFKSKTWFML